MKALTIVPVILALALAAPAAASGGAVTINVSLAGQTSPEPGSPTCAGGTAFNLFTFKTGHYHQTDRPNGTVHSTLTVNGDFLQVPDDPSQPTYTGHFAFWDADTFNKNVQNSPNFTTNIKATGSDGSVIHIHWTFFVQTKDGQVHIDNYTFTCH
jgi:hypothetical protein